MGRKLSKPLIGVLHRCAVALGMPEDYRLDELAAAMGHPYGTVRNWQARGSVPTHHLRALADRTGHDWRWLEQGDESADSDQPAVDSAQKNTDHQKVHRQLDVAIPLTAEEQRPQAAGVARFSDPAMLVTPLTSNIRPLVLGIDTGPGRELTYEVIPRFQGEASAGGADRGGSASRLIDLGGELAFAPEWLDRNIGRGRGLLASIQVSGDSMSPTIMDGETVVIDTDEREVHVSGVYVIAPAGRYQLKRIQLLLDGSLKIMSDNTAYEPEIIASSRVPALQVVGRMVWPRLR